MAVFQAGQGMVGADVPVENSTFVPTAVSVTGQTASMNPGTWVTTQIVKNPKHATIKAMTPGMQTRDYRWSINGEQVHGSKGSVKVGGSTVHYEVSGDAMTVAHGSAAVLSFMVGVTAVGKDDVQQAVTTCVEIGGETSVTGVASATWSVFQQTSLQTFGNIDP